MRKQGESAASIPNILDARLKRPGFSPGLRLGASFMGESTTCILQRPN